MRGSWKMRRVVREFVGPHPTNPRLTTPVPRVELECGHVITDTEAFHYLNEKAVAIKRVLREFTGAERRVRCYTCGEAARIARENVFEN